MPPGLVADENVDSRVINGLLLKRPELDIVRVQDIGLSGRHDRDVLEWTSRQGRILLTYDKRTIGRYVNERIAEKRPVPGVIVVKPMASIGTVIDDILLMLDAILPEEWADQLRYIPM